MLASAFGTGQIFWSLVWFFLFMMWMMLIFMVFGDLFRDRELGGVAKVLWIIFIFAVPYLGVFVYLIARGGGMADRAVAAAERSDAQMRAYVQSTTSGGSGAAELQRLADLRATGAITEEEFAVMKAKVIG
jgi:hypothetical protein